MQKKNALDYFSGGMAMPNRQIVNGEPYRYAFQGQEKDPETGKEAFQLRLWDGRIGRWLSPDPYGQFDSPYLGMGNDPINGIDPDGGFKWKWFARLVNFAIAGDGVQWSKSKNEFFVKKWSTTGDGGIMLENFFKSPIEFYANGNGKIDFGLQAGFDVNAFGAKIGLEAGHDVRSLIETNLDTRALQSFSYNRFSDNNTGNYYGAQNDRATYFGVGGIIGYGKEYKTSRRRDDRILGFIQNVGDLKSKEFSGVVGTSVTNYNHIDKTTTTTNKWVFGGNLKLLLGIHGKLELGVNFNYNTGEYNNK